MRLTLVRHGETDGQSSIRYYGRTDVPLSALGRTQMERVRRALTGQRFAAVYASTLCRAVEAATIVCRGSAVRRVAGFDEINFGAWEGLTVEEIRARDPEVYAHWAVRDGDFRYPAGESTRAFRRRVGRTLRAVLADAPPGDLLFVVHKGIIRCVLTELLQLNDSERAALVADLASIHVISRDNGRWRAEALNRVDHLRLRPAELSRGGQRPSRPTATSMSGRRL
ncbi:MAG: histidine phosphatase family protein [Candidatus Binatia bacterium]